MKKQTLILKKLYEIGRKIPIQQVESLTNLTNRQVHNGIWGLKKRGLIKIYRTIGPGGYKSPPTGTIKVEINENVLKRIKTILENARQN